MISLEETTSHFNTGRRGSIGLSAILADCTSDTDHQVPSLAQPTTTVGNVAVDDLSGLYCDEVPEPVFSLHDSLLDISGIIKPSHMKVEDMKPVAITTVETTTTAETSNPNNTSAGFPAMSSLESMLEPESFGITKEALALWGITTEQEKEAKVSSKTTSKKRARSSDDSGCSDDDDVRSTSSRTSSRSSNSSSSSQPARRSYRRLKGTPLVNEQNITREMQQQQQQQQQGANKKARTTTTGNKRGAQKTISPEEARLEKNRQSAKECRLRKKEYVNNLERQVSEYQKREKMHLAALEAVKSELSQLQRNFAMLKSRHDEQIRSMQC